MMPTPKETKKDKDPKQAKKASKKDTPPKKKLFWFLSVGLDRRKFPRFRCASVPVKIGSPASPHPSKSMSSRMVCSGCDSHCGMPCVALVGAAHTNHTHTPQHTHTLNR